MRDQADRFIVVSQCWCVPCTYKQLDKRAHSISFFTGVAALGEMGHCSTDSGRFCRTFAVYGCTAYI